MNNIPNKIVIIGYMGSGKSTIGKSLASNFNFKFIDLDDFIVENEGLSVNELFEIKGQDFFRKTELKYLKMLLKNEKHFVLALGGGTPTIKNVMNIVNKNTYSIYLKASDLTLSNRLYPIKSKRPLLKHLNEDDIQSFVGEHMKEREKFYEKANWILEVNDYDEDEVLNLILTHLKSL